MKLDKMLIICTLLCFVLVLVEDVSGQEHRWQQRVEYSMDVALDVGTHKLAGKQRAVYYNNSPDTLRRLYYHLYFNAFQPGSLMDVRSRHIKDPDPRVGNRIRALRNDEIGYQKIKSLHQDGASVLWHEMGTIMEVTLAKPVLPGRHTTLAMEFEAQVPVQIRRSGRNNKEGIDYSMAQWYPKLAEYDYAGWHVNPYVAREFHGVWGDYAVNITIDPSYTVAGTGLLINADSIGHGYESPGQKSKRQRKPVTWRFRAENVHDFVWAADPNYNHLKARVPGGPELHFFYQPNEKTKSWEALPEVTVRFFEFMNAKVGPYPYPVYSIIQGGDGGMEYPMATLVVGEGKPASTISTVFHEVAHSWFQGVLANNEAVYGWMDEGFAQFVQAEAKKEILGDTDPFGKLYDAYVRFALSGKEEPMTQFSDFYTTNDAYKIAVYYKGCILLNQLRGIVGEDDFWKGMRAYYASWKFRHPEPIDFIRTMERTSGMQLKWYFNYWVGTTRQIDYAVLGIEPGTDRSVVRLARKGEIPMPVDLEVTYRDGSSEMIHIPLNETFGTKAGNHLVAPHVWNWVDPNYTLEVSHPGKQIARLEIDPGKYMADVHPDDNYFEPVIRP